MKSLQLTSAKTALITLGLLFCLPFAQEADASLYGRQEAFISALDSIEENAVGFSLNGRAKGGFLSSVLKSDDLERSNADYSAFTDFLLGISVRPSNETKASFDLRFHKDWQSAYREGNNSPTIRWWSYDGNILDKKLKFNLGTMRVAYTPLTIYLPEPDLIMEPEVFSALKKDAMEERYLDGTNRRLLHGINLEFRESIGMFDNILLQATLARLRKTANQSDREYYDFDPKRERFAAAARFGVEAFGLSFGVSDVYAFDRFGSSTQDTVSIFEKNNVLSFELGYNSKKAFSGPVNFGASAEYAVSDWKKYKYTEATQIDTVLNIGVLDIPSHTSPGSSHLNSNDSLSGDKNAYPYYKITEGKYNKLSKSGNFENNSALLANAFAAYSQDAIEAKLSGHFLKVDYYFESELAASPAFLPNLPILNSNAGLNSALGQFRAGSLENMYYSLYYSLPLSLATMISTTSGANAVPGNYETNRVYNNYKLTQYYRNAYTQQTYTRVERASGAGKLDPAVNLALPYGYATPDRTGGGADLSFAWNKAVNVRGVFGAYSSDKEGDYTRFGGGLEIDVARLAGLNNALTISGSYEQNKEENGAYNPQVDRIMAGLKVGIWRGLSLTAGFQQLSKEFETPYLGIVEKTGELLLIGGPQIKISEKANFSLQGGLLSNSIEGVGNEKLDLDKYIASGIVTVEF